MIVLIVGPSGVGKTKTCKEAGLNFPNVVLQDLDGMAAQWAVDNNMIDHTSITLLDRILSDPERLLSIGIKAIEILARENPNKHLVIDVGAGFQVATSAAQLHSEFIVVALTATPEAAYRRIVEARNDDRTFDQYRNQEYADKRIAVYKSAHHTIDTSSQSQQQTLNEFIALLVRILGA